MLFVIIHKQVLVKWNSDLQDYEVLFYVFHETDNALVAIIPALSNKGLIEVEMENARREILEIMVKEEPVIS